MANDSGTSKKRKRRIIIFAILAILIIGFAIWYYYKYIYVVESVNTPIILEIEDGTTSSESTSDDEYEDTSEDMSETISEAEGVMHVHMIDCGQADSFLFEQKGKYVLIDCGTRGTGKDVVTYMQNQGVKKLEFVVGTHPHDDHMGGMYTVLSSIPCKKVYIPKVEDGLITTNWYMQLMQKISDDKIKVVNPKVNDKFRLGDATFKVVGQLSPDEAGTNLNNYSTVIKVSFGTMDILMTGDAETEVENKILESKSNDIQCEILKLGHHGSNTSTSDDFLEAVDPDYGLISCEVGNKYLHPSPETVLKLKKHKVKIYRTDEAGSVVLTISNDNVEFDKKNGSYKDGETIAKGQKGGS